MASKAVTIRQGSTPAFVINLIDEFIEDCTVYVTLSQNGRAVVKTNHGDDDPSVYMEETSVGTDITVILSQEETLRLIPGSARVQLRWVTEDGTAETSNIGRIEIGESLLKGVIEHG